MRIEHAKKEFQPVSIICETVEEYQIIQNAMWNYSKGYINESPEKKIYQHLHYGFPG